MKSIIYADLIGLHNYFYMNASKIKYMFSSRFNSIFQRDRFERVERADDSIKESVVVVLEIIELIRVDGVVLRRLLDYD